VEQKFPVLNNVKLFKNNTAGGLSVIEVTGLAHCAKTRIEMTTMFPFARTDSYTDPEIDDASLAPTPRMAITESIARLLAFSFDGQIAPYQFHCNEGQLWRFEKSAAGWLLRTGRWERVPDGASPCMGLRFVG